MKNVQYYLDRFRVTEKQLDELICTALSRGGDYADLFFEYTVYQELLLRDGQVSSGGFHVDYGVGIRVLKGERTGYAYSESTEMRDMLAAAAAASYIAKASSDNVRKTYGRFQASAKNDFYPVLDDWSNNDAGRFIPVLTELEKRIFSKDSRTVKVIAKNVWSESEIMMYNSFGELTYDFRPIGNLIAAGVFIQNDRTESRTVSKSFRTGAEMLDENLVERLAGETVSGVDDMFAAIRPKGGRMPVVMGAGASGILLHEAMGHSFEADFNRKDQSVFSGMLGKKVCNSGINIVDDATIRSNRGACNYDDEGVPGQRTYLVRDGILESYIHDRLSANSFGLPSTGNGRRESFRFYPLPRMRATYMENGQASKADIIASVKKGIYVDEFSNGQVQIGEGDFTFYVKRGYLIENGRLTAPVKDLNVIGNGPRALADITAVGNDLEIDDGSWTCGKDGQEVPVSCGMPTVLVGSLTVGGE